MDGRRRRDQEHTGVKTRINRVIMMRRIITTMAVMMKRTSGNAGHQHARARQRLVPERRLLRWLHGDPNERGQRSKHVAIALQWQTPAAAAEIIVQVCRVVSCVSFPSGGKQRTRERSRVRRERREVLYLESVSNPHQRLGDGARLLRALRTFVPLVGTRSGQVRSAKG